MSTNKTARHKKVMSICGLNACALFPPLEGYAVYGEDYCGWTSKARDLLAQKNLPFKYIRLGDARRQFAAQFAKNHPTIPMVFQNGQFIGGCNQLMSKLQHSS